MLYINGTDISITKGDSACIEINLTNKEGEPLSLTNEDAVKIQVRDWQTGGVLFFEGAVSLDTENSKVTWYIHPEDTKNARNIGEDRPYYWDGELQTATGDVYTFVDVSRFIILPEITLKGGA